MAINSQTVQGSVVKGRVKCTPLQGTGVPPPPKYNNLEEWFQDVSADYPLLGKPDAVAFGGLQCLLMVILINLFVCFFLTQNFEPNVRGVAENVEVVRTFYTYRPTPKSDISIWYADGEFGFYEGLPKRVADIHATHVVVEVRNENQSEPIPKRSDLFLLRFTYLVSETVRYLP